MFLTNPNWKIGCSVFTSNGASGRQFQRDVNVGMVSVNNPHNAPQANFSFSSNKASFLGGKYEGSLCDFNIRPLTSPTETNFYGKDCLNVSSSYKYGVAA
jgi:acyl-CoA reductase-like NAD-dependent aldehyde dehydrogenase